MAGNTSTVAHLATCGAGILGALACWFVASRSIYWGRRWPVGWGLVALALLTRSVGDLLWLYFLAVQKAPTVPAALRSLEVYSLAAQPVLLCVGLLFLTPRTRAASIGPRLSLLADALVGSSSVTALLWWFWIEPAVATHTTAHASWVHPTVAFGNTLALALVALSFRFSRHKNLPEPAAVSYTATPGKRSLRSLPVGSFALALGVAAIALAHLRFAASPTGRTLTNLNVVLLCAGPLLVAIASLWQWITARDAQRNQTQNRLARSGAEQPATGPSASHSSDTLTNSSADGHANSGLNGNAAATVSDGLSLLSHSLSPQTGDMAPNLANAVTPGKSPIPVMLEVEVPALQFGTTTHPAELLTLLLLPCFVGLVSAWHFSNYNALLHADALLHAGSRGHGLWGEVWWAPAVVALAALRFVTTTLQHTRFMQNLRERTTVLKDEVSLRTHQLATLHAVAADLNNTLNREQVLSTALERMIDAAQADAGAVWLRTDFDGMSEREPGAGNGAGIMRAQLNSITNAAFLRREEELREVERRHTRRDTTLKAPMPRWRLVRSSGGEKDAQAHALNVMNEGLERGGLTYCAQICSTDVETFGSAHVAPIRWKGEVMGALGVMRWQGQLAPAERALLESIALEVGAALQNAYLYQEARRRADLDGVTDLFNHRTVQEKLSGLLQQARQSNKVMTIVMMDLNNFKFFNDTYGHPVGDTVLRTVAQCLRDTCRTDDVIGRYGGDEFVALLPDTDAHGALEVCSRIAARVEEEAYQGSDGRRIPIGLSFGAAVFPHDGDAALELLTIADANLYEAKRGGAPLMIQRSPTEETQELRQLKDVGVGGSFGVLDALVTAIDNKDHYTRRHSEDVTHWASLMARELGYSTETQRAVRICGLLHDVGKIAVPDAILRKPGRLNDDEFQIMQQHPVFGALIVKDVPNLNEVLGGIRHHHERYDGKGYPDKLKEEDIPMMGRLLAVPDCFSAMTTDRPYRKALTWSEALTEIERGKGTQFDPVMVDAFLEVIARIVADSSSHSLDREGTRQSVVQLGSAGENNGQEPGLDQQDADGEEVVRPRSVMDADTDDVGSDAVNVTQSGGAVSLAS
ncbi:MAG TPA: diguanylate cyclase [Abditibacteriaceae bacterium]|jgi:diguanylate cyclase (GGDEF)-like protein/putative nucleotidyltransferase with HDIG domain